MARPPPRTRSGLVRRQIRTRDRIPKFLALGSTLVGGPPMLRTRRVSPDGKLVTIDISGCTFGAGRRPCPGADQATARAAGVLDVILECCELADQQIDYLPSPNLRMPARLLVTLSQ